RVMSGMRAPANERLLVTPRGQRKDPPLAGQAAITDVVDEPVDLFQLGFEHLGKSKILIPLVGLGMNFEEDAEHRLLLDRHTQAMQSISMSQQLSQIAAMASCSTPGSGLWFRLVLALR